MSVMDISPELVLAKAVLDYGDQALMLECGSTADVLAWAAALRAAALGQLDRREEAQKAVYALLALRPDFAAVGAFTMKPAKTCGGTLSLPHPLKTSTRATPRRIPRELRARDIMDSPRRW